LLIINYVKSFVDHQLRSWYWSRYFIHFSFAEKACSFQDILYVYDVDVIYKFVNVKNRFLFSIIFITLDAEIESGKSQTS